jgi:hypothetical protein
MSSFFSQPCLTPRVTELRHNHQHDTSRTSQCYFFGRQGVRGSQKINCLALWRSKAIFFGGGWRPEGRQVINSTGVLRHSRTPTNEFGCHCLAGGILRISSSSDVRTVYRHIQHRAAPRPPGCKGGSVVMNKRDKRTGTGLRLNVVGTNRSNWRTHSRRTASQLTRFGKLVTARACACYARDPSATNGLAS